MFCFVEFYSIESVPALQRQKQGDLPSSSDPDDKQTTCYNDYLFLKNDVIVNLIVCVREREREK